MARVSASAAEPRWYKRGMPSCADEKPQAGLLGDTPMRNYARKLGLFMRFAEPELRAAIATLGLAPGMHVLDAGCGSGEALAWVAEAVGPHGHVLGVDLSDAHVSVARRQAPPEVEVVAADLMALGMSAASLDAIWSSNTLHHFADPLERIIVSLVYSRDRPPRGGHRPVRSRPRHATRGRFSG